jgi:hypothetical protein
VSTNGISPTTNLSRRVALGCIGAGAFAGALAAAGARGRVAAQVATPQPAGEAPNQFVFNSERAQITFATTSFSGEPQLTYQGLLGSYAFAGDQQIGVQETDADLGRLVTVILEEVPDLHTITLTLLVPGVNLVTPGAGTPVATLAILTTHYTTIGGPGLVKGAQQTYEAIALQGTAELVRF